MNKNVKAKIGLPHKTKPSIILFSILLISLYFSNEATKPFLLYTKSRSKTCFFYIYKTSSNSSATFITSRPFSIA